MGFVFGRFVVEAGAPHPPFGHPLPGGEGGTRVGLVVRVDGLAGGECPLAEVGQDDVIGPQALHRVDRRQPDRGLARGDPRGGDFQVADESFDLAREGGPGEGAVALPEPIQHRAVVVEGVPEMVERIVVRRAEPERPGQLLQASDELVPSAGPGEVFDQGDEPLEERPGDPRTIGGGLILRVVGQGPIEGRIGSSPGPGRRGWRGGPMPSWRGRGADGPRAMRDGPGCCAGAGPGARSPSRRPGGSSPAGGPRPRARSRAIASSRRRRATPQACIVSRTSAASSSQSAEEDQDVIGRLAPLEEPADVAGDDAADPLALRGAEDRSGRRLARARGARAHRSGTARARSRSAPPDARARARRAPRRTPIRAVARGWARPRHRPRPAPGRPHRPGSRASPSPARGSFPGRASARGRGWPGRGPSRGRAASTRGEGDLRSVREAQTANPSASSAPSRFSTAR